MTAKQTTPQSKGAAAGHTRGKRRATENDSVSPGPRGDSPENKPDELVAEHGERAQEHIEAHEAELEAEGDAEAASEEDARHGYSQDAGYAQSGGHRKDARR